MFDEAGFPPNELGELSKQTGKFGEGEDSPQISDENTPLTEADKALLKSAPSSEDIRQIRQQEKDGDIKPDAAEDRIVDLRGSSSG